MDTAPPSNLILDLTSLCNLRCLMCNVHYRPGVKTDLQTMPDAIFAKLEPLFPRLCHITLGGNGEPFLDPRIFGRLERIRAVNPDVFIEVFTNATRLDSEAVAARAVSLIDRFLFSVNAFREEVYESIMAGSRFRQLQENLARFREARRRSARPVTATAECLIMRRNIPDLARGVEFCREFGLDTLVFKPMWIIDAVTDREFVRPAETETVGLLRRQIQLAREAGAACGVEVSVYGEIVQLYLQPDRPPVPDGSPAGSSGSGQADTPAAPAGMGWLARGRQTLTRLLRPAPAGPSPCRDPWCTVQVFESGIVYFCCQGMTQIGDLRHASFDEIWHGREARAYRRGMERGLYYGACRTCNRIRPADLSAYFKPYRPKE